MEEDTAIYTKGNQFHVLGSGLIIVIDGMAITSTNIYETGTGQPFGVRDLGVCLLSNGACYTIPTYD